MLQSIAFQIPSCVSIDSFRYQRSHFEIRKSEFNIFLHRLLRHYWMIRQTVKLRSSKQFLTHAGTPDAGKAKGSVSAEFFALVAETLTLSPWLISWGRRRAAQLSWTNVNKVIKKWASAWDSTFKNFGPDRKFFFKRNQPNQPVITYGLPVVLLITPPKNRPIGYFFIDAKVSPVCDRNVLF